MTPVHCMLFCKYYMRIRGILCASYIYVYQMDIFCAHFATNVSRLAYIIAACRLGRGRFGGGWKLYTIFIVDLN